MGWNELHEDLDEEWGEGRKRKSLLISAKGGLWTVEDERA